MGGQFCDYSNEWRYYHGRVNAKIIDYSGDYVTQGTFEGGGYMNIKGTRSTPSIPGWTGPLVWDGISW